MSTLEASFEEACLDGTIPGAVLMAANSSGTFHYAETFGVRSLETKQPLQLDTPMWIASCTKLMTSIAALQCVERGQIKLDDDVSRLMPELAELEIITGFDNEDKPILKTKENPITLRHLVTHSAGLSYEQMSPLLTRWRKQRGEKSDTGATVVERNAPLLYEPGTSWCYGTGLDWAGKLVERLTEESLERYMMKNIWRPLGITDITFRPENRHDLKERMAHMSVRGSDGKAVPGGDVPHPSGQYDCFGGHGATATVKDYFKILRSLLLDDEKLLKRETTRVMFEPQLTEASKEAMGHIFSQRELSHLFIGSFPKPMQLNWGIGGLLIESDEDSGRRKGTLIWSGMPNLFWFIDRTAGLCGMYGGQVMPPGDPQVGKMISSFEKAMYLKAAGVRARV